MRKHPPAKFVDNGHTFNYYKNNKKMTSKIWRCDKRGGGCIARIHTDMRTNKVCIIFV